MRAAAVALALVTWWPAATAAAPPLDDLAAELADRGYAVEPGSGVDPDDVAEAVTVGRRGGSRLHVAVRADASDDPTVMAGALLDRLGEGTVLVVVPGAIGYESTEYSSAELDRAADAALPVLRTDVGAGTQAFATTLTDPLAAPGVPSGATPARAPLGLGTVLVVALLVAGGVALVVGSQSSRRAAARRLAEARAEVRHQLDVLSDRILSLTDRVAIADSDAAAAAFAEATAAFAAASDTFPRAGTEAELVAVTRELDRARWQIDTAEALVEGRPAPAQPGDGYPDPCFFDPDHGSGVAQAEVRTSAGTRSVGVCRRCAAALEAGQAPEPRQVTVGGQEVPVAAAPRPYGGRGMADLDVFSVLAGGRRYDYRWGAPRRRGRFAGGFGSGIGGFGGGIGGGIGGGGRAVSSRGRGGRSFSSRGRGGRSF